MTYRAVGIERWDADASVERACASHHPLGAYASADRLHYLFAGPDEVLDLTVERSQPELPSPAVAGEIPAFDWHEREMRDTRGAHLTNVPIDRPLFIRRDDVPPALCAEGHGVGLIVVGPVHAGIIEPGRFTFSTGGETVIHLDAQLSYSRRGVERALEGRDAGSAASSVARVCGACSVARSWAFALALETLAGVTCDERTQWARLVFAELERLYNHLFDLASTSAGAGFGRGQIAGLGLKERVHRLLAALGGHRFGFDTIVPGGIRPGAWQMNAQWRAEFTRLKDDAAAYARALFGNQSALRRFVGAGIVEATLAARLGAVGPARRASNGAVDIRALVPYGPYRDSGLVVAQDTTGDVAARARVKREEIATSCALIERALTELADGIPPPPAALGIPAGTITTLTEGPRGTESVSVECDADGRLARLHLISASYRNWPVVVRAMEGNIVPDFPLVNKSFNLCYACADR